MTSGARAARFAPGRRDANRHASPRTAARAELASSMSVDEALRAIVAAQMVHLRANQDGVLACEDAEYVHQMRVAVRRLRSALRLFPDAASAGLHGKHARTLKKVADGLGKVRDLDVFEASVLDANALPRAQENRVLAAIRARAQVARVELRSCLRSAQYTRLMSRLSWWLLAPPRHPTETSLVALARRALVVCHKAVTHDAARLARLTADKRHRLRIEVKQARYAAEFFAGLFDHRAAQTYASALAELQDLLGSLTDINTAQVLLRELGVNEKTCECLLDALSSHAAPLEVLEGLLRTCMKTAGYWKRKRR